MTRRLAGACLLAVQAMGCVSASPPAAAAPAADATRASGEPVDLAFVGLDGRPIGSADLAGRMSLVVLAATFDMPSQAAVRIASALVRRHQPRINGLLVVVEPEANRPLVETFVAAMDLPFPVALADADALAEKGAFAGLRHVPSFVLLDRDGREVWRRIGLANAEAIEEVLRANERR